MATNRAALMTNSATDPYAFTGLHDTSGDEAALVAAAQAGISDAMNELLARHKKTLYRAARRFTRSHEDAEDLVQDAMLRAFVNMRKFRKESKFATWLIAIVSNAALSMKRKRKRAYFLSMDETPDGLSRWDVADVGRNPEEQVIDEEILTFLQRALLRQPRTHRILLSQCVFDEARIGDAAPLLGLTRGSAKSILFRTRRRIADSFVRRGLVKKRNHQAKRVHTTELPRNTETL